jgi:hypothetical protein
MMEEDNLSVCNLDKVKFIKLSIELLVYALAFFRCLTLMEMSSNMTNKGKIAKIGNSGTVGVGVGDE